MLSTDSDSGILRTDAMNFQVMPQLDFTQPHGAVLPASFQMCKLHLQLVLVQTGFMAASSSQTSVGIADI
jgi:hypothetical protein